MTREKTTLVFLLSSAFLLLTWLVARNVTRPVDLFVMQIIQRWHASPLDFGMYFFTLLGSIEFSCFAVLVISWYLYSKYEWSGAFLYLFYFVVFSCVELVWKHLVIYTGPGPEFNRNPVHWEMISFSMNYSFPSGHTFRSVFLFGIWFQRLAMKERLFSWTILLQKLFIFVLCFGVGYSRIYLGIHWLSDVLGGYLLAAIGLVLASNPFERELRPA